MNEFLLLTLSAIGIAIFLLEAARAIGQKFDITCLLYKILIYGAVPISFYISFTFGGEVKNINITRFFLLAPAIHLITLVYIRKKPAEYRKACYDAIMTSATIGLVLIALLAVASLAKGGFGLAFLVFFLLGASCWVPMLAVYKLQKKMQKQAE